MRTKTSEKQLFLGVVFLVAGLVVLLNTTFLNAPVKISEKGLLFVAVAIALLFFSVRFFSKSIRRQ
jgi:flagellar biosynthesis protein FliQ